MYRRTTITGATRRAPGRFPKAIREMKPSFARSAIVLGLLTAVGPFAIDMYLPALPMIAAAFGSLVTEFASWRLIFVATAFIGLLGLALNALVLTETRPPEQRLPFHLGSILRGYLFILSDWRFVGVVLIGAFGMGSFFAFLSS